MVAGRILVVLAVLAVAALVLAWVTDRGSSAPSPTAVAAEIGADSCTLSGYEIRNRLDGSRQRIYDCLLQGRERCVTTTGGLASDSTDVARLLFANTLSGGKPSCAV